MDIEVLPDDARPGQPGKDNATLISMLASLASLLLGYAVLITGNGLLGTLISLRMIHAHDASVVVGLVQSAYYAGFMLGAVWGGSLIERVGHHRAFSAFAAVATCAALAYAISDQPLYWAMLRFATGFCLVGIFTVMESWLQAAASNRFRGRIFSFYLITTYLGVGTGQFLINLSDPVGFVLFSVVGGLFAASLVPVTLAGNHAAQPGKRAHESKFALGLSGLHTVYRLAPLGIVGCLAAGLLNSSFYAMYPVFMRSVGYSVPEASRFMGFALIAALLPQWPVARLSDRFDRRRIILSVALALASISSILLMSPHYRLLEPLAYLYVSLLFTVYGLIISSVNDRIPSAQRVAVSAALLLIFALGGIAGPTLASLIMAAIGPRGLYLFAAAVTTALGATALLSLTSYPKRNHVG